MPKMKKSKTKIKDNVVPFNKPKVDKKAEEEENLRQNEQDRLNTILREKCNEVMKIIDTAQIDKNWGLYAFLFHVKQTTAFELHPSEYVRVNDASEKEIVKNQREYLQEHFPEFISEDSEENTKKVLH